MIDFIPSKINTAFAVYSHALNGQTLFVGVCRMADLMHTPDARRNSVWVQMVKQAPDAFLRLALHAQFTNESEAIEYQAVKIAELKPWANLTGTTEPVASGKSIRCIETGETFVNASAAARACNISSSSMSNHLNGKPYYRTVGGKTFKRF